MREREQAAYGFDDVEEAVEGARAVGIHGVHFRSNAPAIAEIDALLRSVGRGAASPPR